MFLTVGPICQADLAWSDGSRQRPLTEAVGTTTYALGQPVPLASLTARALSSPTPFPGPEQWRRRLQATAEALFRRAVWAAAPGAVLAAAPGAATHTRLAARRRVSRALCRRCILWRRLSHGWFWPHRRRRGTRGAPHFPASSKFSLSLRFRILLLRFRSSLSSR